MNPELADFSYKIGMKVDSFIYTQRRPYRQILMCYKCLDSLLSRLPKYDSAYAE